MSNISLFSGVALRGVEPRFSEPKSGVIPIYESAIAEKRMQRYNIFLIYANFLLKKAIFFAIILKNANFTRQNSGVWLIIVVLSEHPKQRQCVTETADEDEYVPDGVVEGVFCVVFEEICTG